MEWYETEILRQGTQHIAALVYFSGSDAAEVLERVSSMPIVQKNMGGRMPSVLPVSENRAKALEAEIVGRGYDLKTAGRKGYLKS